MSIGLTGWIETYYVFYPLSVVSHRFSSAAIDEISWERGVVFNGYLSDRGRSDVGGFSGFRTTREFELLFAFLVTKYFLPTFFFQPYKTAGVM